MNDTYAIGNSLAHLTKSSQTHEISYSLAGKLQLSQTGWLVLTVPMALVRGAFDALHEEGVELPKNVFIPVMSPAELSRIGGPDKVTERGHSFRYTMGPVRSHEPGSSELSRRWYIQIYSQELKRLRHSYGLEPYLKNTHSFQLPVAVRKTNVIVGGDVTKASEATFDIADYDLQAIEKAASATEPDLEPSPSGRNFIGDVFSLDNLKHMAQYEQYHNQLQQVKNDDYMARVNKEKNQVGNLNSLLAWIKSLMAKQSSANTFEFEGDVQGVGLRKTLHQILNQRKAEGLAYNDARANKAYVWLNSNNPKSRDNVLRELRNYLDSREAKYQLKPVAHDPQPRDVTIDNEGVKKFVEGQGFTGMAPTDQRWRQWLIERYRLKGQNGHLTGRLPELAAKQIEGAEPVYAYQLPGHPDYEKHQFVPKFK